MVNPSKVETKGETHESIALIFRSTFRDVATECVRCSKALASPAMLGARLTSAIFPKRTRRRAAISPPVHVTLLALAEGVGHMEIDAVRALFRSLHLEPSTASPHVCERSLPDDRLHACARSATTVLGLCPYVRDGANMMYFATDRVLAVHLHLHSHDRSILATATTKTASSGDTTL